MSHAENNASQNLPQGRDSAGSERQEQPTGYADTPRRSPTSGPQVEELCRNGFEACELIVGVDYTRSNRWNGEKSFDGKCLHDTSGDNNPYMKAMRLALERIWRLDNDSLILCYGFGDDTTEANAVFSFLPDNKPIKGVHGVIEAYKQITRSVVLSGPTSFAPLIRQAMCTVHNSGMKFHCLLILADSRVSDECLEDTRQAIAAAAVFPLFIVLIGIGDGPWSDMEEFCKGLHNLHFVQFDQAIAAASEGSGQTHEERLKSSLIEAMAAHYEHAREVGAGADNQPVQYIINSIPFTNLIGPPADISFHQYSR